MASSSQSSPLLSRHPTDEPARIIIAHEREPYANMAAALSRTCKMARHLTEMHIAVIDFQEKLRRTLQPCVQAAQANRFK